MTYDEFKKQAGFEADDKNWMMRKDTLKPGAYKHLRAQEYGMTTSFMAALLLGAALGYVGDKTVNKGRDTGKNTLGGAVLGGLAATAANVFAPGLAALTPTRTQEEHASYSDSGTLSEWLIPGVARYNSAKTYGYALHGEDKEKPDGESD